MVDLPRNSHSKGKLRTINLLAPTSLDQLIFTLKILYTLVTKQATLMRRSTVQSLSLHLVFPALTFWRALFVDQKTEGRHHLLRQGWQSQLDDDPQPEATDAVAEQSGANVIKLFCP